MKHLPLIHHLTVSLVTSSLIASSSLAQTEVWFGESPTPTQDVTVAVAPDGVGGAFTAGVYNSVFVLPPYDTWIARSDDAGQPLWRVEFGHPLNNGVAALIPDGSQGVFAAGYTGGDLAGTGSFGRHDAWLAHYDAAGGRSWIRQFGGADDDYVEAGVPDGAGGVFLCGRRLIQTGVLRTDAWVARFDAQGQELWTVPFSTSQSEVATSIAPDGQGGVFVGGSTTGQLGGASFGNWDAWIARVSAGGSVAWVQQFGSPSSDQAKVIVPDSAGGAFIAGATSGALSGVSAGATDAWVARYDSTGAEIWTRQFGSAGEDSAIDGATDGTGGLFLIGRSIGDLGSGGAAAGPAWTAHLDAGGNEYWIQQYGQARDLLAVAAASNGEGGLFLAGSRDAPASTPMDGPNGWLMRFDDIEAAAFCGPAVPNSSGSSASLSATGSSVVLANQVRLIASDLPLGSSGFFLASRAQGAPQAPPGSQGNLCLGGSIGRYVGPGQIQNSGASGSFSLAIDLTAIPQPLGSAQALPGETWRFQAWFRDAGPTATSNFTDGLGVVLR